VSQPTSGLDLVIERAALDHDFRQYLLVDPKRAIADVFGVVLPDTFRLRFIERHVDVDLLVVLPDPVDDNVSADQLNMVSGGFDGAGWLGGAALKLGPAYD
jgi:hypothetical protein